MAIGDYANTDSSACGGFIRASEIEDEADDGDSFFDLEFNVPGYDDRGQNHSRLIDSNISDSDEDVYGDLAKKEFKFVESPNVVFESTSKPQSPISFLRSPPKFPIFMLFKKVKTEKTETGDVSPETPTRNRQSKRFNVQCKVEELPIISMLTRVNSSRSKFQKPKDMIQKYLKLIKPLYIRLSKRNSEKPKLSDEFSAASPSSSPARAPFHSPRKISEDNQGIRSPSLRIVYKHLGKSRSAMSAAGTMPSTASKSDDALQQHHDGIQSAILHCKRSYNSSREFSVLSRCASDPCHEISVNPTRFFIEEKKRISI